MSYSQASSSVTATSSIRRSTGLIFVVALHVAAILAIKIGLGVSIEIPRVPPIHFIPTVDKPTPPPIPVDLPKPPQSPKFTFTIPVPKDPVFETSTRDDNPVDTSQTRNSDEGVNTQVKTTVITARVDPTHPLTQPAYPAASRRGNEQGRVELMLYILANGKVSDARIAQGSGYSRLDESALREALRSWRFIPQQENGIAVASWQRFAITYRLEN